MALIKQAFYHDFAYHRINSFEYHRDRKRVRIRLDVYPTKEKSEIIGTTEYQIDEKSFINNCRMAAEKAVSMAGIKKLTDDKIERLEKELNKELNEKQVLTQSSKNEILQEIKDFTITEKMKDIGKDNFRLFIEDLEAKPVKTMALLYDALKLLTDELKNAVNC
jgi:hypothetical protein